METTADNGLGWGSWVLLGAAVLILAMAAGGTLAGHLDAVVGRVQGLAGTGTGASSTPASSPPRTPASTQSPLKTQTPTKTPARVAPTPQNQGTTFPGSQVAVPVQLQRGLVQLTPSAAVASRYEQAMNYTSGNRWVALGQHVFDWVNHLAQGILPPSVRPVPTAPAPGQAESWLQYLWYGPSSGL